MISNTLSTDRLILRAFTLDDVDFIIQLLNTPGWLQFIGDRGVKTVSDAEAYLLNGPMKSYQVNGFGLSMVALKSDGRPIGMCGLIKRDMLEDVDIGYALLPEFAGQGYAFEIASATLDYAKKDLGFSRIVAITDPQNSHSIRLLEKLGLRFEKMVKLADDDKEIMFFGTT